MSPAEKIARFIKAHPGEWQTGDFRAEGASGVQAAAVLSIGGGLEIALVASEGEHVVVWALRSGGHHVGHVGHHVSLDAPLLTRIAFRVADCLQLRGGSADTLPPWLADPVRRQLRTRAGELLTLAGSSPADVVSAAETLDEALCKRPVVEVTGVLRALMSVGMSCRWATGADEAANDYVGFVSRRLDVVAGERDALAAQLAQVQAMQAAQEEYVTARMVAARSVLRGVADEPRASQVTALDAADAYLVDALYRKPKPSEITP